MLKLNRNSIFLILCDLLIIIFSALLSILIKFDFNIPKHIVNEITPIFICFCISIKIVWFFIFSLYKGMYRYTSILDLAQIIKANCSSSISILLITFTTQISITSSLIFLDFILCSVITSSSRLIIRVVFNHFMSSKSLAGSLKNKKKRYYYRCWL